MSIFDALLQYIGGGSIASLPPILIMAIPLILGLILGFFVKKFLKIVVVAGLIIAAITYLGLFNLRFNDLKDIVAQYGPQAAHYAALFIGMLPLSGGFIIGLILGFLFG
jgi:uncharacterized membrane protein (Fun14 family)